jgi:hypothetical protein
MPFVERTRKKAILPEMASLVLSDMNPSRVFIVRAPKAFRQGIDSFRNGYHMNVVWREAIRQNLHAGS